MSDTPDESNTIEKIETQFDIHPVTTTRLMRDGSVRSTSGTQHVKTQDAATGSSSICTTQDAASGTSSTVVRTQDVSIGPSGTDSSSIHSETTMYFSVQLFVKTNLNISLVFAELTEITFMNYYCIMWEIFYKKRSSSCFSLQ